MSPIASSLKTLESRLYPADKVYINIELLTQCNLRCSYCYMFNNPENEHLMAADDYNDQEVHFNNLKYIRQLRHVQTPMHFFILGGEPTIYADLQTILKSIRNLSTGVKPTMDILTNGFKFESLDYTNEFLKNSPDCGYVLTIHYEHLSKINYNQVIDNMSLFSDNVNKAVQILLPINEKDFLQNIDELIQLMEYSIDNNLEAFFSLVDIYSLKDKVGIIEFIIDEFHKRKKGYLLDHSFFKFTKSSKDKNDFYLGRFDFLSEYARNKIKYKTCNLNTFILEKDGSIFMNLCSALGDKSYNIMELSPKKINDVIKIHPTICPYSDCPVNYHCVPKRTFTYVP